MHGVYCSLLLSTCQLADRSPDRLQRRPLIKIKDARVVLLVAAACGPPAIEPKFSDIEPKIFRISCALPSCHGEAEKGGLSLVTANAYGELVNVAAEGADVKGKGLIRVVPGKPEQSFLIKKLTGPGPGEGNRMPDVAGQVLNEEKIEAIRQWIAEGARN